MQECCSECAVMLTFGQCAAYAADQDASGTVGGRTVPPTIDVTCHGYIEAVTRAYNCIPAPSQQQHMSTFVPPVGSACDQGIIAEFLPGRIVFQIRCREGARGQLLARSGSRDAGFVPSQAPGDTGQSQRTATTYLTNGCPVCPLLASATVGLPAGPAGNRILQAGVRFRRRCLRRHSRVWSVGLLQNALRTRHNTMSYFAGQVSPPHRGFPDRDSGPGGGISRRPDAEPRNRNRGGTGRGFQVLHGGGPGYRGCLLRNRPLIGRTGDLLFASPTGTWAAGTYVLVVNGEDAQAVLPIEPDWLPSLTA